VLDPYNATLGRARRAAAHLAGMFCARGKRFVGSNRFSSCASRIKSLSVGGAHAWRHLISVMKWCSQRSRKRVRCTPEFAPIRCAVGLSAMPTQADSSVSKVCAGRAPGEADRSTGGAKRDGAPQRCIMKQPNAREVMRRRVRFMVSIRDHDWAKNLIQ